MKKVGLLLIGVLLCVGCSPTTQPGSKQDSILNTNDTADQDSSKQQDSIKEDLDNVQIEQQEDEVQQEEQDNNKDSVSYKVIKESESEPNIEGMNLWKVDESIEECKISVYTSAAIESNGEILLDDNNEFAVLASIQGKEYILLEREPIQLGVPEVSIYMDYEANNQINIILSDMRTAQCKISQYLYVDGQLQCYELINKSGGNYIEVL